MKTLAHKLIASLIFLSLGSILFVSLGGLNHHQATLSHEVDCPFMSHEDTICPMSSFDHISIIRSLLETTRPDIFEFFAVGAMAVLYLSITRPDYSLNQKTKVFMRWRQLIVYRFFQRAHQALLASGILHPKLFS